MPRAEYVYLYTSGGNGYIKDHLCSRCARREGGKRGERVDGPCTMCGHVQLPKVRPSRTEPVKIAKGKAMQAWDMAGLRVFDAADGAEIGVLTLNNRDRYNAEAPGGQVVDGAPYGWGGRSIFCKPE